MHALCSISSKVGRTGILLPATALNHVRGNEPPTQLVNNTNYLLLTTKSETIQILHHWLEVCNI